MLCPTPFPHVVDINFFKFPHPPPDFINDILEILHNFWHTPGFPLGFFFFFFFIRKAKFYCSICQEEYQPEKVIIKLIIFENNNSDIKNTVQC